MNPRADNRSEKQNIEIKAFPLMIFVTKLHDYAEDEQPEKDNLLIDTVIGETPEMQMFEMQKHDTMAESIGMENVRQDITMSMMRIVSYIEHLLSKYENKKTLGELLLDGMEINYQIILAEDQNVYGNFDRAPLFEFLSKEGFKEQQLIDMNTLMLAEESVMAGCLDDILVYITEKIR